MNGPVSMIDLSARPIADRNRLKSRNGLLELGIERVVVNVRITLGHIQVFMAQKLAQRLDGNAGIEQTSSEGMAKLME